MEEAQARGHALFYYTPDRLALDDGRVTARGWPVEVRREAGNHFTLGDEATIDLAGQDVVWLRQDPPFDMGYITTTHILERIHPRTLVVNDPFWVRNYPEKLLVLQFPELTPPTTVARDLATLKAFKARHGDIILKPLYGNGGAGVFRLDPNDRNFNALWELFAEHQPRAPDRAAVPAGGGARATSGSSWSTARRSGRSTGCRRRARPGRTCTSAARRRR